MDMLSKVLSLQLMCKVTDIWVNETLKWEEGVEIVENIRGYYIKLFCCSLV